MRKRSLKKSANTTLRWDVSQRLLHLEAALIWQGRVNSHDLTRPFGISRVQASRDIAKYLELAPGNIVYDRVTRSYVAGADFNPHFGSQTGDRLLETARTTARDNGMPRFPGQDVEVLDPMPRAVPLAIVQRINLAINDSRRVEFNYQSIATPVDRLQLDPHRLVHAVGRWHVRGYSEKHGEFRDFVLARITGTVKDIGPRSVTPDRDENWNTVDNVLVRPHPRLNDDQKAVVAKEFGIKPAGTYVKLRRALRFYFEHDFRQLADNRPLLDFVYPEQIK